MSSRRLHRLLAIFVTIPFSVVVVTGCLLQVKRWIPAIQPPSKTSPAGSLGGMASPISWDTLLASLRQAPEARITSWSDVKAIDVRPAAGVARARTKDGFEVQVDLSSGRVLSAAPRYSSLLIEIHEGAWFGAVVRNALFVPAAFAMLLVTLTGAWLLVKHYGRDTWGIFASDSRRSTSS